MRLPALALMATVVSVSFAGFAAAQNVSPSATNAQHDASTVQLRDMQQHRAAGGGAEERTFLTPFAAQDERAADTRVERLNPPRSGVNPSAPSYQQD